MLIGFVRCVNGLLWNCCVIRWGLTHQGDSTHEYKAKARKGLLYMYHSV